MQLIRCLEVLFSRYFGIIEHLLLFLAQTATYHVEL